MQLYGNLTIRQKATFTKTEFGILSGVPVYTISFAYQILNKYPATIEMKKANIIN